MKFPRRAQHRRGYPLTHAGPGGRLSPELTAFFTSAAIFASTALSASAFFAHGPGFVELFLSLLFSSAVAPILQDNS
ncbi:MAG TPA: hypothetical protein VMW51_11620, partial [Terriglobia bacterium]|nr:hypothetical protein [Terriglobia bacterium]